MNQQVEKFDPSTLMQGVKDRIKATFVSLIPDNEWDELVKKEITAFFNDSKMKIRKVETKVDYQSYNQQKTTTVTSEEPETPFRQVIWDFCYERLTEELKKEALQEYFTNNWKDGKYELHENMVKVIERAAPVALINLMQAISYSSVENLRQQLQQYR